MLKITGIPQEPQTLFGFQLWLAENRNDLVNEVGKDDDEVLREVGLSVTVFFS